MRRATAVHNAKIDKHDDFYPRSPCGERLSCAWSASKLGDFYPRSPCGERRQQPRGTTRTTYFYPRSPCGERLCLYRLSLIVLPISIHALLAESDQTANGLADAPPQFLSTLSLRRATADKHVQPPKQQDFYPRSPCGERQVGQKRFLQKFAISIHALLAESDNNMEMRVICTRVFLSTLSLRRATKRQPGNLFLIHHFYPRSPCGERRLLLLRLLISILTFLSTLSLRRATEIIRKLKLFAYFYPRSPCGERPLASKQNPTQKRISIHALLAESDNISANYHIRVRKNFYPRSPCGERPTGRILRAKLSPISIHALLAESDPDGTTTATFFGISIHALLAESDKIPR